MSSGQEILLVDDENDLRRFIAMRLEANGYKVTTAVHGKDALDKLRSHLPDLIVTDVIMPVMDGVDLYQELKNDPRTKNIPILIMTAKGQMEENFRKVDIDEFVAKPINNEEFLGKVKFCLSQSRKENAQRKILLAGRAGSVLQDIETEIKTGNHEVVCVTRESEILNMAKAFQPDFILLDIFIENNPPHSVIKSLRKTPQFQKIPIIIFSHQDKEDIDGQSIHQKRLELENAKTVCLNAGASESIGGFEEGSFFDQLKSYLN